MWMGEGKHFLVFPVRAGRLLNYVGFVPTDEEMKESWSAPGDPAELAREFAGWNDRIESLLAEVEVTFRWGLYDREPIAGWTRGRLTLLGDAAHPMLPHVGQGANQAIEDGMALAAILADVDAARAPEVLGAYEQVRRERTTTIQRGARANQLRYDSAYEDLAARDAELAAAMEFRAWIYDHDVLADLEHQTKEPR
jgi:2-polyprenyl-6-methoxyphenol hydroxylase-like FAD-dependent oxidoreductase